MRLAYSIRYRRALRRARPRHHRGREAGFLSGPVGLDLDSLAWLAISAATALVVGVSIARFPGFPATLVPAVLSLMGLAMLVRALYRHRSTQTRHSLMKWTLGAFFLHQGIAMVISHSFTLVTYFGGDAITYDAGGWALAQHWSGIGPMPLLPAGKDGFFYLLGALYYVVGHHAGAGLPIDAAMAAAVIPLLHDATDRHFGPDAARYVPPLCLFMPGFLIWGSQLLREPGVYLGIAMAVNAAVRLQRRITLGALSAIVAAGVLTFAWRASIGILMVGGLLVAMILQRRAKSTAASALMAAAAAFLVLGIGLGHDGVTLLTHTSFKQINGVRMDSATSAASGYLPSSDIANGKHALFYLPLGTPLFLFGPLPWEIHGGRQFLGIFDVVVWWALLPSLWRGFRAAASQVGRAVTLYVAPALANAIGLSLIIANFGTAVRERMQVIVFLIPLIALGLSLRPGRQPIDWPDPVTATTETTFQRSYLGGQR